MAPRLGSKQSASEQEESPLAHTMRQLDANAAGATLRAYLGLVGGAALTHLVLNEYGTGLPRWARFVMIVAGSAGAACLLASLVEPVRAFIARLMAVLLLLTAGALLWSVV
jgi:hypothetical protein